MNIIELVVGDSGGDGHDKTVSYFIETEATKEQILAAYTKGVHIIGFDLINDVAVDYEDSEISEDQREKLVKSGFCDLVGDWDEGWYSLWGDTFVDIFLFFVTTGNPELEIKQVKLPSIDIGGYGLLR